MTTEAKTLIGTGLVTALIIAGGAFIFARTNPSPNQAPSESVDTERLVRSDSQFQGPSDSPVTVVEFADFQCPACGALHPVLKQLKNDIPAAKFVFRHFPLESIHKNARASSLAAAAAGQQDKFWPMHDKLFEQQGEWSDQDNPEETFDRYAQEIGLELEKFKADLNNPDLSSRITADQNDGQSLRVSGTPTIFINGARYTQSLSYNNLKSAIEARL